MNPILDHQCLDFQDSAHRDNQHVRQPQRRPVPALALDEPLSSRRKQVAFVPTMEMLEKEFPHDEDEDSVGASSNKASCEIITPANIPNNLFSRIKYNYELSKLDIGSAAALSHSAGASPELDLCATESWRSFNTRLTEEFFKHRKDGQSPSISVKLQDPGRPSKSKSHSSDHRRCSSNSSKHSNVAVCDPLSSTGSGSETQSPRSKGTSCLGQDQSSLTFPADMKTAVSTSSPFAARLASLSRNAPGHGASAQSSQGSKEMDRDSMRAFARPSSSATDSYDNRASHRTLRHEPAISNLSMISSSAVCGSERSILSTQTVDVSPHGLTALNNATYNALGLELLKLVGDPLIEPEKLCEDLIEYFGRSGLSGRLVYCFGLLPNESAIRLEPLRQEINTGADTRTITLFTAPAQIMALNVANPASSLIKAVPCIELNSGLTRTIHRLQRDLGDRETTRVPTQGSNTELYVDESLAPITGKEVYSAVEVCCFDWTNYDRRLATAINRTAASHGSPHGPSSPPAGAGAAKSPFSPSAGSVVGSNAGCGAPVNLTSHEISYQGRSTSAIDIESLIIPSYESLHSTARAVATNKLVMDKRSLTIPSYASLHPLLPGNQGAADATGVALKVIEAASEETLENNTGNRTSEPIPAQSTKAACSIQGPYGRSARWISPCPGGKLLGDCLVTPEPRFPHRRAAAQYKQARPSLPLVDMPVRRRRADLDCERRMSLDQTKRFSELEAVSGKINDNQKTMCAFPTTANMNQQRLVSMQCLGDGETAPDGMSKDKSGGIVELFPTLF